MLVKAMGAIQPITLETANWDSSTAPYGIIDEFMAVIDGRNNLNEALKLSRELIQKPQFQAIAIVRNSTTLSRSYEAIADFMLVKNKFGNGVLEGRVFAWPERGKYLYRNESITTLFPNKTFRKNKADKSIGPDFHDIFWDAKKIFPEYLCWSVRKHKSGNPGILHYDECYRPGLRDIFKLSNQFVADVNNIHFAPLEGAITLSVTIANGGSIVCNTSEIMAEQNIYDQTCQLTGFQAQEGDLLILKDKGWDANKGHQPAFHCPPKTESILSNRFVAIASSNASYLSPQVREFLGRSRLPSSNPRDKFLDLFDHIESLTNPELITESLENIPTEILKSVPKQTLDRFPETTRQRLKPYMA